MPDPTRVPATPPRPRRSSRRCSSACRTRPARRSRSWAPAPTPTRPIHDWGQLPAALALGQHARRGARTRRGTSTCTTPSTRRASSAGHGRRVRPEGQVRPLVGQGVPRRRARPAHPQRGQGRVPLPHRERRQPEDGAAAGEAGGGRQDDAQGRDRVEHRRAAGVDGYQPAADGTRRSTTRPTSPSRRTATSTSPTATARTTSTSTTRRPSTSGPSAGAAPSRAS